MNYYRVKPCQRLWPNIIKGARLRFLWIFYGMKIWKKICIHYEEVWIRPVDESYSTNNDKQVYNQDKKKFGQK